MPILEPTKSNHHSLAVLKVLIVLWLEQLVFWDKNNEWGNMEKILHISFNLSSAAHKDTPLKSCRPLWPLLLGFEFLKHSFLCFLIMKCRVCHWLPRHHRSTSSSITPLLSIMDLMLKSPKRTQFARRGVKADNEDHKSILPWLVHQMSRKENYLNFCWYKNSAQTDHAP